jgi:hypothetical protein
MAAASSMAVAPAALATTTPPPASTSGLELSPQPVYQEQVTEQVETPINQTPFQLTYSGKGTLTLPNSTEIIRTTSTGSGIVSMMDSTFVVKGFLTTEEDRSQSATATFYGIARFNMQDGSGKGIVIALFHTNSTGTLAPIDGMILAGQMELPPGEDRFITLWEWQSGIPLATTTTMEEPPLTDTTTTTTNATTTAEDTNATAARGEEGGEEAAIGLSEGQVSPEEGQQAAEEQEEAAIGTSVTNNTLPPTPLLE